MDYPIRVLHIVSTMDLGGVETMLMNLYRQIDREKIQFDFLCHNRINSAYTNEIVNMGGRMYMVEGPRHVGWFAYKKQLYNFFTSHQEYQIVHAHQTSINGVILNQARLAGISNRFSHSHAGHKRLSLLRFLRLKVFLLFFSEKNITKAFACSELAADYLYKGKLRDDVIIIPNAIDTGKFRFNKMSPTTVIEKLHENDGPIIGHVGRFMKQKNHDFIIDVFLEILKKKPSAKLVLVGDGQLYQEIKEKVNSLGISESVFFLGSRNDVPDLLRAFDLLLFPSLYEGLSVVCVEAQASGLPILTSTNVSDEICLTKLVQQKSLQDSAESWAIDALKLIDDNKNIDRSKFADEILQSGFDSNQVALKMQNLYLSIGK